MSAGGGWVDELAGVRRDGERNVRATRAAVRGYVLAVAEPQTFFRFRARYLPLLVLAAVKAWFAEGPIFVLGLAVITAALLGAYYIAWRWWRGRQVAGGVPPGP